MLDRWFMTGVIENDKLLWITELGGHIMKMSLSTHNVEYVNIEDEILEGDLSHSSVVYQENGTIYAFINWGKRLLIFNEHSATYKFIYLGLEKYFLNMCASVSKVGNELLVVPMCAPKLLRINISTGEVQFEQILKEEIETNDKEVIQLYAKCEEIEGENIWIFSRLNSDVICYNPNTREKTYYKIPIMLGKPTDITIYEGKFYVLNSVGDVFLWEKDKDWCEKIFDNPKKEISDGFSVVCIVNKKLWIFPSFERDILLYDLENKSMDLYDKYPKDFSYFAPKEMAKYSCKIQDESCYYFAMHSGNYIFSIDKRTGEGKWIDAKWPREETELEYLLKRNRSQFHEQEISIETFLNYITVKATEKKESVFDNGNIIWEKCKGV